MCRPQRRPSAANKTLARSHRYANQRFRLRLRKQSDDVTADTNEADSLIANRKWPPKSSEPTSVLAHFSQSSSAANIGSYRLASDPMQLDAPPNVSCTAGLVSAECARGPRLQSAPPADRPASYKLYDVGGGHSGAVQLGGGVAAAAARTHRARARNISYTRTTPASSADAQAARAGSGAHKVKPSHCWRRRRRYPL